MVFLWEISPKKDVGGIPNYNFPTTRKLDGWGDERLARNNQESDVDFLVRANRLINSATYNCDPTDSPRLLEKLLLLIKPEYFVEEGLLTPKYFHCGFCSQRAYLLAKALEKQGIEAIPFSINGHVVVRARVSETYLIADPDVGIDPVKYEEINSNNTKLRYQKVVMDEAWLRKIYHAIEQKDDDKPYTSMRRLDALSEIQEKYISLFEWFFRTIGAIGMAVILYVAIFSRRFA